MSKPKFSRRNFLKLAGVTSAGLSLSACGVKATDVSPTKLPIPTETLVPTATLTFTPTPIPPTPTTAPTMTPSPTVEVKVADLPQTKVALDQFVAAMNSAGVQVDADQIRQGLSTKEITGKDGRKYEIALTQDGYPLLIKAEGGEWSSSLRQFSDSINMKIGTSITKSDSIPEISETDVMEIKKDQFNSGLLSLYWPNMEKSQGSIDYSMRIDSAEFANQNGMDSIGHLVLWGKDVPEWLKSGNFSREQLIKIMQERVRTTITTMTQYGVTAYIVVNEAGSGNDIFWNKIGPDYIEIAFQTARDTSKGLGLPLTLIYNDYDNNTSKQKRTAWTLKMVEDLKQKDLIDAVGLETIIDYPDDPSIDGMAETMQSYKIPVIISESAVNMKNFYGSQPEREKKQAQIYNNLVSAALQSGVCKDFIVFEPIDELTPWEIEPTLDGYSKNSDPSIYHLVDGKIQPKLSYFSIKKGMVDWLIGSTNQ